MTSLRQLRILDALLVTGSVSSAAERVGITQPAASKALANLQTHVGFRIFEKTNNRLTLTRKGQSFYDEAKRLVRMAEEFDGIVDDIRDRGAQRIRLATTQSLFSSDFLAHALKDFSLEHPHVRFEIEAMSRQEIVRAAASDRTDLAVAYGPFRSPDIATEAFGTSRLCAIAKRGAWLRNTDVLKAEDFAGMPAILFFSRSRQRQMIDQYFYNSGCAPTIVAEVANASATISLARAGVGVGVCDLLYIHSPDLQGLDVRRLSGEMSLDINFVQRTSAEPSQYVDRMKKLIEKSWHYWSDKKH